MRGPARPGCPPTGRARRSAWLTCAALVAALLPLAGVAQTAGAAGAGRTPTPVITPARAGTQCVEPPAVMRRLHMTYLKHQRDETVHGGIRGAKYSLKGCVDCHASAATGSVAAAPADFCVSCHQYAAVLIDCFECHASKPDRLAQAEARR